MYPSRDRRAITLVEALVIVAAIAILAALLFPVFARAREQARHASAKAAARKGARPPASVDSGGRTFQLPPEGALRRRIIYTAEVRLAADRLASVQRELARLVRAHGGYVAAEAINGDPGAPRMGVWKLRVPVERYDAFIQAVTRLGELQQIHSDSQDVTEEFFDLEARLANKRVEEQRLLQHLRQSTARLTDILAVERELSRVRGEIEQMQGRLRFLASQAEMTTITVTVQEARDYVPSARPAFTSRIARTFGESLGMLAETLQGAVLVLAALLPWLLTAGFLGVPAWLLFRRKTPPRE